MVTGSSAPYTLQVNFQNTCSLANGTYNATIAVYSSGASNSPVNLPVTLTVGPVSSPAISLSPTSLTFNGEQGGSNPSAQDISVSNSGGGSLASPTAQITYGSGRGWLSVQTQGSSAPYTLVNQPGISGLSAGTYTATANVSSSGASNTPQSYSVTLVVASSGSPAISLSPSGLSASMTGQCSGNPATQNVTISNAGGGSLATPTFVTNYSQGSGWLNPSITGSSAPYTMKVQFQNTCGLALGTYHATIGCLESYGFVKLAHAATLFNLKQPSCGHTMAFFSRLLFAPSAVRVAGGDSTGFHCEIQNEQQFLPPLFYVE